MSAPLNVVYLGKFEAGHQSSRARIPGVPKIGVQNLLLHTAKVGYDGGGGNGLRSLALQKRELLTRFTFQPIFSKGIS